MKYLTTHMQNLLAARNGRPVLLVTLQVRSVTGGNTTYTWATQSDGAGTYGYQIGGSGTVYRADIADPGVITRDLRPLGGIATLSGDEVVLVNPKETGALWSDIFDSCDLDEAEVTLAFIMADGSETASDLVDLARGIVAGSRADVRHLGLPWRDSSERLYGSLPSDRLIDPRLQPYAPRGNWGRVRPVVLGDLTGQAFDVTTPSSGVFPHVSAPAINAQRQRFDLFDASSSADRETLVKLYDHIIQVPDASRTLGANYIQFDTNEFWLWLRPHRIDNTTAGVANPEYACSHDLDEYAWVSAGTALFAHFPGANANLGQMGAGSSLAAGDATLYTIYSKVNQGETNPGQLTLRLDGVGITGHTGLNLNDAGTAVNVQQIGDHLTGWNDLRKLEVIVSAPGGVSGVNVRRILLKIVFRSDEVRAAFEEQHVYRSQKGFTESASSPLDDYQDGNYLWGTRTSSPLRNPADIAEAVLRNRNWGTGMRAPSLISSGATLSSVTYADQTSWTVSNGAAFSVGDFVLADREVVLITAIVGNTLTLIRGAAGSMTTTHTVGTALYRFGSGGNVDSASFRGAAGILREPDGVELITNGALEGAYIGGVAPNWSEYDPSGEGTPASAAGYAGRYSQQVTRTGTTGLNPGIAQTGIAVTSGAWYRLSLFARCVSGTTYIQLTLGLAHSLHPNFAVDTGWKPFTVDFKADTSTLYIRLRNAGATGAIVQFEGVSLQKLTEWKLDFPLTDVVDADVWLDQLFLPQAGLRFLGSADGRVRASACWLDRPSALAIDASRIVVDEQGAPRLSLARTPLSEVVTGVSVRYGYNHLTGGYDGLVGLSVSRSATVQSVVSIADGSPLDTLTVTDSSVLAPKDAADETASNIIASGTTITLPSGNLIANGVTAGDWLIVRTSYGMFLLQIGSVLSATQLTVTERPPQFNDLGQWSAGDNLYLAGSEIFSTCLTPTGTTVTIFRSLDQINLTTLETMQPGDLIWSIASSSNDGSGIRDEGNTLYHARERKALFRMVRHNLVRTLQFDAPYVRDRQTAVLLRNHLFDAHDRAWLATVTTDLSTLALDVGDYVTIEHDLVPDGTMTGEIVRQSVDVMKGEIEYVVRG